VSSPSGQNGVTFREVNAEQGLPQTNLAADTGLLLLLFHPMTESEEDYIIEAFHAFTA
jgi:perosamine synthetase